MIEQTDVEALRFGSPQKRYMSDPEFHALVEYLTSLIVQARYTPSELREACILAAIHYEQYHLPGKLMLEPASEEVSVSGVPYKVPRSSIKSNQKR